MTFNPRVRQILQAAASTVVLLAAWQIASLFLPALPVSAGAGRVRAHGADFVNWPELSQVLETAARIFAGLFGAFILGCVLALLIGRYRSFESWSTPFLVFLQGIPALSWVVIAIIWFHGTEFRIFFIMVITTLPAFTFQILDAYRSMSKDLFEMTMSFRPSGWTLFRVLIVPTIVPGILTALKVNLGNSARVVVVAELVGATGGVGYELLLQQQLFDMAGAIAWTMQLVLFVLVVQQIIVLDRELAAALPRRSPSGRPDADEPTRSSASRTSIKEFPRPDGRGTFMAVDRLSFEIDKGEIVAVLGKTGCGKSTMFNLLAGLIEPTSGKVEVIGHDPFREFNFFRGKIGIVFQNDRLMPWRSALDNVVLGLQILDAERSEAEAVARRWLARLGLSGHENDYPHALSGGMRQRVSIARAFAVEPDILLCDEPFSSLDEMTARDLRAEFVRLVKQTGKTAVFITHHINEAMDVGDRIMVFHRPARIAYEARMDAASKGAGRQAIQDEILKVLSLEAGEGTPAV